VIRLLIDGRAVHGGLHGIARYTLAMAEHLPSAAPELRCTVICHPASAAHFKALGARVVLCKRRFASPLAPMTLSRLEHTLRPDVFFCPSFVAPLSPRSPLVITIHDATHLIFPHDYSRGVGLFYQAVTLPAARAAAHVVTVSEYSRASLREAAGLEAVEVIPNGVDHETFRPEGPRDQRLQEQTILYAGGYKPHKRVELLIDAVAALDGVQLAVAGVPPAPLIERAVARGVGRRLLILGDLDDHELAACYRGASCFAYPSIHEGFGLPPLEAMACGAPVVCADASSLPEVVGDAARLFAGGVDELTAALRSVLEDRSLARAMARRGLERAQRFTWARAAARVAELLRSAAQGPRSS